ncbi:helix-turn-helix domain-containing protein [Orbus sturtevantii]|uniref:helix-turn-helix domain-containing protein n=1 Tax=Orbus sturtevantii TaxID=3074109 RepID=UPI00370D7748
MLVNEYVEVQAESDYTLTKSNNITFTQDRDLTTRAVEMLEMWGIYNSYSSKCGHKPVSAMFAVMFTQKCYDFIENEIDFIESCMLDAKKSNQDRLKEQQKIAELYYKGYDIVDNGCDWSERLNICDIAKLLDTSKSTIHRKLREFDGYIVSKLINFTEISI